MSTIPTSALAKVLMICLSSPSKLRKTVSRTFPPVYHRSGGPWVLIQARTRIVLPLVGHMLVVVKIGEKIFQAQAGNVPIAVKEIALLAMARRIVARLKVRGGRNW